MSRRDNLRRDIDDELQFHIDARTEELIADGVTPEEARLAALDAFGDIKRIRRTCERISSGVSPMLHKLHIVVTTVLLLAVLFLGYQARATHVRAAHAIDDLHAQRDALLHQMERVAESSVVYVEGDVARPGTYQLPGDGLTARRAVIAAGGSVDGTITVQRDDDEIAITDDLALQPGDIVRMTSDGGERE